MATQGAIPDRTLQQTAIALKADGYAFRGRKIALRERIDVPCPTTRSPKCLAFLPITYCWSRSLNRLTSIRCLTILTRISHLRTLKIAECSPFEHVMNNPG